MVTALYCVLVIMAFAVPSECIKRKGSHGGWRYRREHEIPPRFRALRNVQHPQGNGPPLLQGPQARPQPDNRLRAEAAPFTPLGAQTPLPTGYGPYFPQVPAWGPEKKNICPLMCHPGQLAGEQCSSHPNCRCTIDLQYPNFAHLPCVFTPSRLSRWNEDAGKMGEIRILQVNGAPAIRMGTALLPSKLSRMAH
uniref:Putative secreted protein n=1 Tax=Amblyomma triste TaxID=251400 RepID=A0A023G322_AMBTT